MIGGPDLELEVLHANIATQTIGPRVASRELTRRSLRYDISPSGNHPGPRSEDGLSTASGGGRRAVPGGRPFMALRSGPGRGTAGGQRAKQEHSAAANEHAGEVGKPGRPHAVRA